MYFFWGNHSYNGSLNAIYNWLTVIYQEFYLEETHSTQVTDEYKYVLHILFYSFQFDEKESNILTWLKHQSILGLIPFLCD